MEPQLRALGLHTTLIRGVPSLNTSHDLCKSGDVLSSEQCRILKLLGIQMAVSPVLYPLCYLTKQEFRINLGSRWSKQGGFIEGKDEVPGDEHMDSE